MPYAGPPARPGLLRSDCPTAAPSSRGLGAGLARQVADRLRTVKAGSPVRVDTGEPYATAPVGVTVEVLAGATRHAQVEAMRLR